MKVKSGTLFSRATIVIFITVLLTFLMSASYAATVDGINIPGGHPRIWWTPARITQAQGWFAAHPFTPDPSDAWGNAFCYVVTGNATYGQAARTLLMNFTISPSELAGTASDNYRWNDWVPIVFDWCHDQLSPSDISTFVTRYDGYVQILQQKSWGGPGMPYSNYYTGYFRNEMNWAIASYGENSNATQELDFATVNRWQNAFLPYCATGTGKGGVPGEGSQYGRYMLQYPVSCLTTAELLGRNMWRETNFYKEALFYLIYSASTGPVYYKGGTSQYYQMYTFCDDEVGPFMPAGDPLYGDFATTAAMEWSGVPVGAYARNYLNVTQAVPDKWVASVDTGGSATSFSGLPLDYYAPGDCNLYTKTSWNATATQASVEIGKLNGRGHYHLDWGSFQMIRGDRWLTKETAGYSNATTGWGGSGSVSINDTINHNGLLFSGNNWHIGCAAGYQDGDTNVTRMESQPNYTYVAGDLTGVYTARTSNYLNGDGSPRDDNPFAQTVVREFLFVRPLETMVIFDRVLSCDNTRFPPTVLAANVIKTFVLHSENSPTIQDSSHVLITNGNQAMRVTTLLPSSISYATVYDNNNAGADWSQYRLEINHSGEAQSYFLNVLQAKASGGADLAASVVDNGGSYTVTLTHATLGNATVVFQKGATSSGGQFGYAASGSPTLSNLTSAVQSISVTDSGPIWSGSSLQIVTSSLPADTVNVAYNQTLSAAGGTSPYTWAIMSGGLPAGLSLVAGTGAITGTPTASGTSSFTAKVTDNTSATASRALSIIVNAAPSITTSSLPNGSTGVAYNQTLAATGGTTPLAWSLNAGSLPTGLSLNSATGAITGTPTATGTSSFTAKVADGVGASATKALSIAVSGGSLVITTTSLPGGAVSVAYSQSLQATGGSVPYTWSIQAGSLPAGLSLVSGTGVISGTPTATGTSNFTAKVTDNGSTTASQALSITISSQQSATLQDGLSGYSGTRDTWINSDYPDTNDGSDSTAHLQYGTPDAQLHRFDLSSIPAGSTINSATLSFYVYSLTGTPNVNAYRVITHWDEMQATWNSRLTGTAWGAPGLQSGADYNGAAVANSGNITAVGWASFSVTSLVQGWVSNTYANEGVMYTLGSTGHLRTYMREYATDTTLRPKLVITYTPPSGVSITTSSLPADTVGVAYSQTLAATGGATPYTWSLLSGTLPAGLALSGGGVISGTPTTSGTSNFTVKVTDNASATASKALSIVVNAAVTITTASLPADTVGVAYPSTTLGATGGTGALTWSLNAGSLPAGLALSAGGAITGTPTAGGTSNFTAKAADTLGASATKALSITINAAVTITTASLPADTIGVAYPSTTLGATGGTGALTWSLNAGSLPAGLSLVAGTGAITGTPTTSGTSSFTAKATDTVGASGTKALSIVINAAVNITTSSLPAGTVSTAYSQTLAATGGTGSLVWSLNAGSLPAGLSLTAGGVISGTPTASGTSNFTAKALDTVGASATKALSITVNAGAAQTYYVATNGSDSNNGSSGTPWLTLQYAVGHINAGDTIIVRDGTYVGCRMDTIPGSAGAVKSLKAEHHLGAILNAKSGSASHNSIIELEGSGYWDVEDFKVNGTGFDHAIDIRSSGYVTVKNCETYGTTKGTFFTAFSDYSLIEGNSWHGATVEHGFYASNSADYGTARLNTSYGNAGCGLQLNGDASMGGDGIMSNWLVEKNTLYNNDTTGGSGINLDGACDSKFLNNLLYNNHKNGMALYSIDGGTGSSRDLIYNNTFVTPSDGLWCISIGAAAVGTNPQDNKIKNCILMNDSSTRGSIIAYSSSMGTNFQSDYNAVLDRFSIDQTNETVITLATWRGYGYDTHSFITTKAALFVDPTNNDYHLKAGSPAINAGTTLTEVTDDIAGTARPQGGAYDVGCYEVIGSALSITTTSLPADTVGVAYNQTLAATGGTTPYTWSLQAGSLPAGLSLVAGTGAITGTPTNGGTSSFTAKVTDNVAATATKALSIVVNAAVAITTASLPADTVNIAYNQTLAATGGTGALTWALQSGSLPAGLSLVAGTGAITGTPTTAGAPSFTAKATDTLGASATKALSIAINAAPSITTSSLPGGTVSVAYNQTLASTGGTTPLTWSISSGSLPAGLSIAAATGAITGTPTASGTSNFTARVTDNVGASATKALSIVITSAPIITTASLPADTINIAYSQTLAASGGTTPYTWAISSGSLPTGLSLASGTGVISGTPTATGTSSFTARVTDNVGATGTKALSIVVNAAPSITTASLPAGTINAAYSRTLAASGGTTPYTWAISSGSLPAGLSIASGTGVISGTPTASGTSNFTARVTDNVAATATKALSIVINAAPSITTASLPAGTVNTAYSQTLAATGGTTPYTWSISAGSLPAGLSLAGATGVISGTPTASGTSNFTARVTDNAAATATKALSITISASSEPVYQFAASDTEASTAATTYQTKTTLTFTPQTSDTWIILAFAEVKEDTSSWPTNVRVTVDGTTEADAIVGENMTGDYRTFGASKAVTLSAASHTILLTYCTSRTYNTAFIRNARLIAIKKASLETWTAATDTETALTTTVTNYASTTFTPTSAGDYLLIYSAEMNGNTTSYSTQVQAKLGGTILDNCVSTSHLTTSYWPFLSFKLANLAASSQTVAIAAAKQSGSAATHTIRRARVAAIRLSGSRFAGYQSAVSDTESTTALTAWQNKLTQSWSVGTAGNWLMLTSFDLANASTTSGMVAQVQVDNATTSANPSTWSSATTDYMYGGSMDLRNLSTGTHTLDVDYESMNAGNTAKIRYVHFIGLPL